MKMCLKIFLCSTILIGIFGGNLNCKRDKNICIETTFYYWRTTFKLDSIEKDALKKLGSKSLYIRFFDVDLDINGLPFPVSEIGFKQTPEMEIIPVVFIKNKVFDGITPEENLSLSKNIIQKILSIAKNNSIKLKEIQIDCDWTVSSKQQYFAFLENVKAQLETQNVRLSATIRLHQVKYKASTGIPPVNKGVLMAYNIDRLDDPTIKNSIFDKSIIYKYLDKLSTYPLQLEVALPIFSQNIIFRNDKIVGILRKELFFKDVDMNYFDKVGNLLLCKKDTMIAEYSVKVGDMIRIETILNEDLNEIYEHISKNLPNNHFKLILFDLSASNLKLINYENIKE